MPGGDGMGPMGMGPMTGRAAGFCAGLGAAGFANPGFGRGRFGGRGAGRGFRNRAFAAGLADGTGDDPAALSRRRQLETLKGQAEYVEGTLGELRRRIETLEKNNARA